MALVFVENSDTIAGMIAPFWPSILCVGFALGCNSAHQMSSADTVPAGKFRFGAGGAISKDPNVQGDIDYDGDSRTNMQALHWVRYGVTDNTEVSLMTFGVLSGAKVGVKHQLHGSRSQNGTSVSLGIETAGQVAPDFGDYTRKVKRVDGWLPIHLGYRSSARTAVYLSPRYGRRVLWLGSNSDPIAHNIVGGVVGVELGERGKLHLELSAFRNLTGFDDWSDRPSENEFGIAGGLSFGP